MEKNYDLNYNHCTKEKLFTLTYYEIIESRI